MRPIESLINNINDEANPIWQREALRRILASDNLSKQDVLEIFEIAKIETGLSQSNFCLDKAAQPLSSAGYQLETEIVAVKSIHSVVNVFGLKPKQRLSFTASGLNVVYGDNASGKSSYVKILKNTCLYRGASPEITKNVFSNDDQSWEAHIEYEQNTKIKQYIFKEGGSLCNDLKSVRVFDRVSAENYAEKEGSIEVKPEGLALLTRLVDVCKEISQLALEEKGSLNDVSLPDFAVGTNVRKFIEQLSSQTRPEDVRAHCALGEDRNKLASLTSSIESLQNNSAETQLTNLRHEQSRLQNLALHVKKLNERIGDYQWNLLQQKKNEFSVALQTYEASRRIALADMPFPNVGNEIWLRLWKEAENFIANDSPQTDVTPRILNKSDSCPLCFQTIEEDASEKIESLRGFVLSNVSKKLENSRIQFENIKAQFSSQEANTAFYAQHLTELTSNGSEDLSNKVSEFLIEADRRIEEVKKGAIINFNGGSLDGALANELFGINQSLEQIINSEQAQLIETRQNLNTLVAEASELKAKVQLEENKHLVSAKIDYLRKVAKYDRLLKSANTASLTKLGTKLSEDLVTIKLKGLFESELRGLGFTSYKVDITTRGQSGEQKSRLVLTDAKSTAISGIASEGEQKCLAIASFFSELASDNRKSSLVLDDPTTSLDHKWRRKIAGRIVEEAKTRQIIVFTHDIALLMELQTISDIPLSVGALQRSGRYYGEVLDEPPWNALKTKERIGKLRNKLNISQEEWNARDDEDRYEFAKDIYDRLRSTWERLVEEILLGGVVTRFRRSVETKRLNDCIGISEDDVSIVDKAMTKCSIFIGGHDRAIELGTDVPTLDEMSKDVEEIEEFRSQLAKR